MPEPTYATIRELYVVKDDLIHAMAAMELRLTAKIEEANAGHEATHSEMRRRADERHRRIDDFLTAEERADAVSAALMAGRSDAYRNLIGALRTVNEFRWLIAAAAALALLLAGNIDVSIS